MKALGAVALLLTAAAAVYLFTRPGVSPVVYPIDPIDEVIGEAIEVSSTTTQASISDALRSAPIADPRVAVLILEPTGDTVAVLSAARLRLRHERLVERYRGVRVDSTLLAGLRGEIVEEFVRRTLLLRAGAAMAPDPAAVDQEIATLEARAGGRAAFEERLARESISLDSLRSVVAERLLLASIRQGYTNRATEPTDADVAAFVNEQSQEVRAQHILFRRPDTGSDTEVRALATAVLDSARAGADFEGLARRHSEDSSAPRGGDLGYFGPRDMVGPISDAAFALDALGDVAPTLIETPFGYHIIRLTGRRLSPNFSTERGRLLLTQRRQQEAFESALSELVAAVVIRVNPALVPDGLDF